jgi:hypothetical protein
MVLTVYTSLYVYVWMLVGTAWYWITVGRCCGTTVVGVMSNVGYCGMILGCF